MKRMRSCVEVLAKECDTEAKPLAPIGVYRQPIGICRFSTEMVEQHVCQRLDLTAAIRRLGHRKRPVLE